MLHGTSLCNQKVSVEFISHEFKRGYRDYRSQGGLQGEVPFQLNSFQFVHAVIFKHVKKMKYIEMKLHTPRGFKKLYLNLTFHYKLIFTRDILYC